MKYLFVAIAIVPAVRVVENTTIAFYERDFFLFLMRKSLFNFRVNGKENKF